MQPSGPRMSVGAYGYERVRPVLSGHLVAADYKANCEDIFLLFSCFCFQENTSTVCAKRVVLALPPEALRHIRWQPLEEESWLKTNIHSVIGIPATKVFLAFPKTSATGKDIATRCNKTTTDISSAVTKDGSDVNGEVIPTTLTPIDGITNANTTNTKSADRNNETNTDGESNYARVTTTTHPSTATTQSMQSSISNSANNNPTTNTSCHMPEPTPRRIRTDMPIRYVEDITPSLGNVTNSTVLQAVFASGPHAIYWDSLHGGATFEGSMSSADAVSAKLVKYLRAYLSRLSPAIAEGTSGPPNDAVVHRWGASFPCGVAWHVWKPSSPWTQVSRRMLKPIPDDDVFIVGSAFAAGHLQMYAEGALQTVDDMLHQLEL